MMYLVGTMRRVALLMSAVVSAFSSLAQDPLYHRLTTRNGLPSNTMYGLAVDPEGFVWFGSDAGAIRYDGTHADVFSVDDGLTDNEVFDVQLDREGRLWFMTGNGTPSFYLRGHVHGPRTDPSLGSVVVRSGIRSLHQDPQGALWFGGFNGELVVLDTDGSVREEYVPDPIALKAGGHVSVSTGRTGDLLVFSGPMNVPRAGGSEGSARMDTTLLVSETRVAPNGRVISTARHVVKEWIDGAWVELVSTTTIGVEGPFRRAYPLGPDELWLSLNNGGVLWLERRDGVWRKVRGPMFRNDLVNDLLRDNEGNLWLATAYGGVIMVAASAVHTAFYAMDEVRGGEPQRAFLDTLNGVLWCGTNRGDLYLLGRELVHVDLPPDETVFSRVTDMTMLGGDLIVATDHHTFRVRDPLGARVVDDLQLRNPRQWKGTLNAGMKAIALSPDGTLMGSQYGLYAMAPGSSELVRVDLDLVPDIRIYAPAYDPHGTLWFEDHGKLLSLAGGMVERHLAVDLAPGVRITDLAMLGDTVVAATSGAGILLYANGRVVSEITVADDLVANEITHLITQGGDIFAATKDGVDRITDLHGPRPKVSHYALTMGPQGRAVRDVVADVQHLYVLVEDGLCVLPRAVSAAQLPVPMPYIRSVLVNDSAVADLSIVGIRRGNDRLTVEFGVVHYGSPERVRMEYRIGAADRWKKAPRGMLDLTALDAGDHVLQVRAAQVQGPWSVPVELKVVMIPRIYERWWARVVMAALLIGLVVVVVRSVLGARFRRREEQVREQELVAQERHRIARDLHDDLGAELSSMLLLTRLQRARPASEGMDRLEAMAGTLTEKMREVIWSTDPGHDTLEGTLSFIQKHLAAVCPRHGLKLRTVISQTLPVVPLGAGTRRGLYLIAKEALNNCIKHSGATTFTMEVSATSAGLVITLADDGVGLVRENGGRGLGNMADRAASIGATLRMEEGSPGIRITVTMPLTGHRPNG